MSTFWSVIVASATWFWNAEMYSVRDRLNEPSRFLVIWVVVSQATAVPVMSHCLNKISKAVMKSVKVPNKIVVPEIQLVRKVVAQVKAEPLVM